MEKVTVVLDQAEVNYLLTMFSEKLCYLQRSSSIWKKNAAMAYNCCDKENPDTSDYFEVFSAYNNEYKMRKKQVKKLSEIQRKLKAGVRKG